MILIDMIDCLRFSQSATIHETTYLRKTCNDPAINFNQNISITNITSMVISIVNFLFKGQISGFQKCRLAQLLAWVTLCILIV